MLSKCQKSKGASLDFDFVSNLQSKQKHFDFHQLVNAEIKEILPVYLLHKIQTHLYSKQNVTVSTLQVKL